MDEEVRKAQRTLERAGIKGLLPEDEFIIAKAIEGFRADSNISSTYFTDTIQSNSFINYLETGDHNAVASTPHNEWLLRGFRYHLGLTKFLVEEAKKVLNR